MIPKFRAWDKETKTMNGMAEIYRSLRCGSKLSLDISGYSKKTRVELFYPEIFISNFEAAQIEMLFYKKLEELTADKFMTFKESEWKYFCTELISKFRVLEGIQ